MTAHRALVRIAIALTSIGLAVGAAGCGSESDPSSAGEPETSIYADDQSADEDAVAQEDWHAQDGVVWEEFTDGYLSGWESGCDIAFEGSPDGSLYDQGYEYTADDCYDLAPYDASLADVPLEVPLMSLRRGGFVGRDRRVRRSV